MSFHGVRGSTPCSGEAIRRYGGNTSCVSLEVPGQQPIVLDIGTGLRAFGLTLPTGLPFAGTALVTHLHWDHVQGLPFFTPGLCDGARLDIVGPGQVGRTVAEAFGTFMRDPYFPITIEQLPARIEFHDVLDDRFDVGDARVVARQVPHIGTTLGYRVEWEGAVVTYVSDHQQPIDGSLSISDSVLELADGADALVHDAQFTAEEWRHKAHWGHCTVEYALFVAKEAGAKRLVLFHHDPSHHDDQLDELGRCAAEAGERLGVEVVCAFEGLTLSLDREACSYPGSG